MTESNEKAPDFSLPGVDEDGSERVFTLKSFKGKKVVIYFYPRDNTPGCSQEACDFRDNMGRIKALGYSVLGISPDPIASHLKFRERFGLSYPLLSDTEKVVSGAYGAYGEKKMYGKTVKGIVRSTFLINEDGAIEKAWRNVKAKGHVEGLLKELD